MESARKCKQTLCPGCRASLQGFDMHDAIHQSYAIIRRSEPPATPMVLLHIGEDRTRVAAGTGVEPDQVLILEIGSRRTSNVFLDTIRHRRLRSKTPSWPLRTQ